MPDNDNRALVHMLGFESEHELLSPGVGGLYRDPNPHNTSLCAAVLRRFGYRVIEAAGPSEALDTSNTCRNPLTLR